MNDREQKQINSEACAWIAKFHDTDPTPEQLREFRAWMSQSPAHKIEIRQLARLWGELNVLTELAVVEPSIKRPWFKAVAVVLLPNRGVWSTATVCATLVLTIAFIVPFYFNQPAPKATMVYSTKVGEQRTVALNDGSLLLLNTDTQITVDYGVDARNLYLVRGQAHFDVAPNSIRPFNVYAGSGLVRAIGTAFSVHLKDRLVDVTVTEGSVQLNTIEMVQSTFQGDRTDLPAEIVMLAVVKAGQNAILDQKTHAIDSLETVSEPEMARKLAWRVGLLRFSGEPLEEVVQEVSRYTSLSIIIQDPAIRDLRIGGFFEIGETDKMFEALEASFGVHVNYANAGVVYLTAAESASF